MGTVSVVDRRIPASSAARSPVPETGEVTLTAFVGEAGIVAFGLRDVDHGSAVSTSLDFASLDWSMVFVDLQRRTLVFRRLQFRGSAELSLDQCSPSSAGPDSRRVALDWLRVPSPVGSPRLRRSRHPVRPDRTSWRVHPRPGLRSPRAASDFWRRGRQSFGLGLFD